MKKKLKADFPMFGTGGAGFSKPWKQRIYEHE
jgi:hypothetical protein